MRLRLKRGGLQARDTTKGDQPGLDDKCGIEEKSLGRRDRVP